MTGCSSERYTFHTEMQEVVEVEKEVYVGTDDHTKLKNLDAPGQHPITAIENLSTELSKKVGAQDTMSNMDIYNIINGG